MMTRSPIGKPACGERPHDKLMGEAKPIDVP